MGMKGHRFKAIVMLATFDHYDLQRLLIEDVKNPKHLDLGCIDEDDAENEDTDESGSEEWDPSTGKKTKLDGHAAESELRDELAKRDASFGMSSSSGTVHLAVPITQEAALTPDRGRRPIVTILSTPSAQSFMQKDSRSLVAER